MHVISTLLGTMYAMTYRDTASIRRYSRCTCVYINLTDSIFINKYYNKCTLKLSYIHKYIYKH